MIRKSVTLITYSGSYSKEGGSWFHKPSLLWRFQAILSWPAHTNKHDFSDKWHHRHTMPSCGNCLHYMAFIFMILWWLFQSQEMKEALEKSKQLLDLCFPGAHTVFVKHIHNTFTVEFQWERTWHCKDTVVALLCQGIVFTSTYMYMYTCCKMKCLQSWM